MHGKHGEMAQNFMASSGGRDHPGERGQCQINADASNLTVVITKPYTRKNSGKKVREIRKIRSGRFAWGLDNSPDTRFEKLMPPSAGGRRNVGSRERENGSEKVLADKRIRGIDSGKDFGR